MKIKTLKQCEKLIKVSDEIKRCAKNTIVKTLSKFSQYRIIIKYKN